MPLAAKLVPVPIIVPQPPMLAEYAKPRNVAMVTLDGPRFLKLRIQLNLNQLSLVHLLTLLVYQTFSLFRSVKFIQ